MVGVVVGLAVGVGIGWVVAPKLTSGGSSPTQYAVNPTYITTGVSGSDWTVNFCAAGTAAPGADWTCAFKCIDTGGGSATLTIDSVTETGATLVSVTPNVPQNVNPGGSVTFAMTVSLPSGTTSAVSVQIVIDSH